MAELLTVPEVATGAGEVLLSDWLVQEGATVHSGDPVAVVETDKAVVEIEADVDGVIVKMLVEPGTTVAVGSPLLLLANADEAGTDPDLLLAGVGLASPAVEPELIEAPAPAGAATTSLATTPTQPTVIVEAVAAPPGPASSNGRRFISPIARRLLREAGLQADDVTGTGPQGRIVRRDVERAVSEAASAQRPPVAEPEGPHDSSVAVHVGFSEEPHSRLRRAIATRLTESKREVPHFYLKRTARLDRLLRLRDGVNSDSPVRISVNDFILRAVGVAYTHVPEANVIWTPDALRRFDAVDVGVAIASERGLVTPVVRGVERSTVSAVSRQVKEFVEQVNAGRLAQRDLEGGAICVTNLGMYGVEEFAAIINPPQSAILAVGAARPAPVVVEDGDETRVEVETTVQLVLSVDHRAIDGALAARWFDALVTALESPLRLLY